MVRLLPALALAVALAGCGNAARTTPLTKDQALSRTEVLEMKVVKVWDVVTDALDHDRDPSVSHVIEVDVLSGTLAGKQLALPFDKWNVGGAPPAEGTTVVAAPADWVKLSRNSKGSAFGAP
jgi:hypothetical protein